MSNDIESYRAFIVTTFKYSGGSDKDLCHCMHGILGEWLEFEEELRMMETYSDSFDPHIEDEYVIHQKAAEKELGDMVYYTIMFGTIINHTPERFPVLRENSLETLADTFKKAMFYEIPHLHDEMKAALSNWWTKLCGIAEGLFSKDIQYFMDQNMEKLKKRYPTGAFTQEDALTKKDANV